MAYIPHVENVDKWKNYFSSNSSGDRVKTFYLVKEAKSQPMESNITTVSPVESEVERAKAELKEERRVTKAGVKRHLSQLSHNLTEVKAKKRR